LIFIAVAAFPANFAGLSCENALLCLEVMFSRHEATRARPSPESRRDSTLERGATHEKNDESEDESEGEESSDDDNDEHEEEEEEEEEEEDSEESEEEEEEQRPRRQEQQRKQQLRTGEEVRSQRRVRRQQEQSEAEQQRKQQQKQRKKKLRQLRLTADTFDGAWHEDPEQGGYNEGEARSGRRGPPQCGWRLTGLLLLSAALLLALMSLFHGETSGSRASGKDVADLADLADLAGFTPQRLEAELQEMVQEHGEAWVYTHGGHFSPVGHSACRREVVCIYTWLRGGHLLHVCRSMRCWRRRWRRRRRRSWARRRRRHGSSPEVSSRGLMQLQSRHRAHRRRTLAGARHEARR
jgi:hypothetical protein